MEHPLTHDPFDDQPEIEWETDDYGRQYTRKGFYEFKRDDEGRESCTGFVPYEPEPEERED